MEFSTEAFRVMLRSGSTLPQAFLNSVLITVGGTALGLVAMCPCAYALSRKEFRHRRALMLYLMIPMIFSGGLVSTYMVNTQVLHLRNSYLALILPGISGLFQSLGLGLQSQDVDLRRSLSVQVDRAGRNAGDLRRVQ